MDNHADTYDQIVERAMSKELALYPPTDMGTGEVFRYSLEERVDSLAMAINTGNLPIHLQQLASLSVDADRQEELLSYYLGVEPRPFSSYVNKEVLVQGAIIRYFPPFNGKDGTVHEGYYKVLVLLENKDEDGNFIVLATSGRSIGEHMMFAIKNKGWYLWEKSTLYRITQSANKALGMVNVSKKKEGKK